MQSAESGIRLNLHGWADAIAAPKVFPSPSKTTADKHARQTETHAETCVLHTPPTPNSTRPDFTHYRGQKTLDFSDAISTHFGDKKSPPRKKDCRKNQLRRSTDVENTPISKTNLSPNSHSKAENHRNLKSTAHPPAPNLFPPINHCQRQKTLDFSDPISTNFDDKKSSHRKKVAGKTDLSIQPMSKIP